MTLKPLLLACLLGIVFMAWTPQPATAADDKTDAAEKPLDLKEPPFSNHDYSWVNGSNRQPNSLLGVGPLTFSLYVDVFYAYQFSRPIDHTIFPATTGARHNEISVNMAALGVDVTGLDGPIGRVYFQYGANVEAVAGQDTTTTRGFYLSNRAFNNIQQAAAGWHYHALHGINVEFGIFQSYIALESYLPQENWNYTHPFVSDFTPYYFSGGRGQFYLAQDFKLELWLVNGWQTFGQWHEARSGGYLWNWRPTARLSVTNTFYSGKEAQSDPGSQRYYTDSYAQFKYFEGSKGQLKSSAVCLVADFGYEHRTNASSGIMTGYSLTNRVEFSSEWAFTARADVFYDKTQSVITQLPIGNQASPAISRQPFWGGGGTVTVDYLPSPWIIYRLEYAHRNANIPYFSGHGGITGPQGTLQGVGSTYAPDLKQTDDRIVANVTLRL